MNESTTASKTGAIITTAGVVIAVIEHHDLTDGYPEPPADPMDVLGCDSCQ